MIKIEIISGWINKLLEFCLVALALYFIGAFLVAAALRISYPFELEWIEGGVLGQVSRILQGMPLYTKPSLESISLIYTPLYFYLAAALAKIFGLKLWILRVVSLTACLGIFVVIWNWIKKETEDLMAALVAVGFFAATYPLSGVWFDVGRVDSLFVVFLLLATWRALTEHSRFNLAASALLFCLAFLTKQSALLPIMLFVAYFMFRIKQSWLFIAVALGSVLFCIVVLNYIHHGWFVYYVFTMPSQHPIMPTEFKRFWTRDLLHPLKPALSISALALIMLVRQGRKFWPYITLTIGMLAISWLSRLHWGGYDNVLMPSHAALAILTGLALAFSRNLFKSNEFISRLFSIAVGVIVLIQFAHLLYNPSKFVPTDRDIKAGFGLVENLKRIPGPIYIPFHTYLAAYAGKSYFAHAGAVQDIWRAKEGKIKEDLRNEIWNAVKKKRFNAIVLDDRDDFFIKELKAEIEKNYPFQEPAFKERNSFWPITGMRARPEIIFRKTK